MFSCHLSWLGKTTKSLFIFLFFSFTLDLLHRKKCGKVSYHIVIVTWQVVTASYHMASHDGSQSHDECGKVVHRPCSSCISSVGNLMGTLLSSPWTWRVIKVIQTKLLHHYFECNSRTLGCMSVISGNMSSKIKWPVYKYFWCYFVDPIYKSI